MWVTTKTIITFDPIKEYERIKNFRKENEPSLLWREYPSTVGATFVNEQIYFIGEEDKHE